MSERPSGPGLSQDQIDALVHGKQPDATGVPRGMDVLPYDFIRPPRISRERRATLEAIYTRFAQQLQSYLSSRLRMPLDVTVSSVEQAMFSEFLQALPTPCAAFVVDLAGATGAHGVIELGTPFSFFLVDRLFGGPGEVRELNRALTALEQTVIRGVTERALGMLRDAWEDHLELGTEIMGFESAPDALQIANREDNVLVTDLEIRANGMSGRVTVCLPLLVLETFLQDKTAMKIPVGRHSRESASSRRQVESALQQVGLEVRATLPSLRMRTGDVAALAVGQVLRTRMPASVPIEVRVNGRLQYLGVLGQSRRRLGVRITTTAPASVNEPAGRQLSEKPSDVC